MALFAHELGARPAAVTLMDRNLSVSEPGGQSQGSELSHLKPTGAVPKNQVGTESKSQS